MNERASESFRGHAITAALVLLVAGVTFFGFLQLGGALVHGKETTVRAIVPTSSALASGARVTMAGAAVGKVSKIERRGNGTLIEMRIGDKGVLPVPADSRVTLRQRTPIGENYVEITPGRSSRALGDDDVLPIGQADEYVDVDQILSVLSGRSRAEARRVIQAGGRAVDGEGDNLNRVLGAASTVVQEGGSLFGLLADDRRQVADLVDRLGRVSAAVGDRGEAVRVTAQRGLVALRALAARDTQLAATLHELPATLNQARSTSGLLRGTALSATPVVSQLAAIVRELRSPVNDLRPAAQQARNAVRELDRAAPPLGTTLDRLKTASGPLARALPSLREAVCQAAPVVRYTKPYTNDAIAAIVGLGSASNSYDAVGHLIRLSPIVGENSLAGLPDEVTQAAHKLLRSGLLGQFSPLTWNPLPKPGVIGTAESSATGKPAISGPKALAASGYKYPRVEADC
jgi:phospholipid/cholesterol/gamma-HCH transport system substrate-binding protein